MKESFLYFREETLNILISFIYLKKFFSLASRYVGSKFPDQGLNLCPLCWKNGVLNTEPLKKLKHSQILFLLWSQAYFIK